MNEWSIVSPQTNGRTKKGKITNPLIVQVSVFVYFHSKYSFVLNLALTLESPW